jgi:three-Cys-motif partner protein
MTTKDFFDEVREQSRLKARIVSKYFWAWAKVIAPTVRAGRRRLAYIDLFAGPGRYEDGTPSTPLMVLEKAILDPDLRTMLVTVFNDSRQDFVTSLQTAIDSLPGVESLTYKPRVLCEEVGPKITSNLQATKLVPTLLFADPWGYKGLSLSLLASVLQNWGCDCIFFFNYNRINPGLGNEIVREHMNDLFGEQRAGALRVKLLGLNPEEREALILEELSQALTEMEVKYVLPFSFKSEEGKRTKHHLIFASKNFKGYEIMKEIMAVESSSKDQGVASFEYSPASERYPTLFELARPLDDLQELLVQTFQGQTIKMVEIYERHNVGRRYIKSNYKKALIEMEARGKISADPPAERRPKSKGERTFGDGVIVKFPPRVSR